MNFNQYNIFSLLSILISFYACNSKPDSLQFYPDIDRKYKPPFFGIIEETTKENIYKAPYYITLNDSSIVEYGQVYLKNSIIYGRLDSLSTKDFILFNLEQNPESEEQIIIEYLTQKGKIDSLIFTVTLQKVIKNYNSFTVYEYKIKDYFSYLESLHYYDVVVFITANHGVIGSYLTIERDGQSYYLYPYGDVLEEVIDYSKMEQVKLL